MSFSEWQKLELKDICYYSKEKISIQEVDVDNYVSTENMLVDKGGIVQSSGLPSAKTVSKYVENDILISNIRPYFKKIWYADKVGGASNDVLIFNTKANVEDKFLYYFLSQDKFFEFMTGTSKGTKMPRGDKEAIMKYIISLPPLEEQKAIANILSSLDEKIELNNQMNKTLEEMAQALFKRWFVDFEFPNEDGQPYKSSGGEMVDSELGIIPKGWEVKTLGELCELSTKGEKPFENKDTLYEHFSLPACDEGKLPVIEEGRNISSNKYRIDNECILISKLNPSTKRIWNPTCNTKNSICSTEFMVYKPKNIEIKDFCYEVINADKFTEFLLANVTGSTGSRQRTQPKKTLDYKIPMVNLNIIKNFNDVVKPLHELIKVNIQNNKVLKDERDTLLPKLMSGEIRVTDLEN